MQFNLTSPAKHQRRQLIRGGAVAVLTVLVIVALAFAMPGIERQLNRWQLLPQQQQLTELYLVGGVTQSTTYTPGEATGLTFAIANRTASARTYQYRIVQTDSAGNKRVELLHDSVTVTPNYTTNIDISVTPSDLGKRSSMRVELIGTGLSISYWMERE